MADPRADPKADQESLESSCDASATNQQKSDLPAEPAPGPQSEDDQMLDTSGEQRVVDPEDEPQKSLTRLQVDVKVFQKHLPKILNAFSFDESTVITELYSNGVLSKSLYKKCMSKTMSVEQMGSHLVPVVETVGLDEILSVLNDNDSLIFKEVARAVEKDRETLRKKCSVDEIHELEYLRIFKSIGQDVPGNREHTSGFNKLIRGVVKCCLTELLSAQQAPDYPPQSGENSKSIVPAIANPNQVRLPQTTVPASPSSPSHVPADDSSISTSVFAENTASQSSHNEALPSKSLNSELDLGSSSPTISPPPSSQSPPSVFEEYCSALKEYYRSNPHPMLYSSSSDNGYVELALAQCSVVDGSVNREQLSVATLEDIGKLPDGSTRTVTIIEGDCGSGKTVLAHELARRWANGTLLTQYDLVLVYSLDHTYIVVYDSFSNECILPMPQNEHKEINEQKAADILNHLAGRNVLCIFDGFYCNGIVENYENSQYQYVKQYFGKGVLDTSILHPSWGIPHIFYPSQLDIRLHITHELILCSTSLELPRDFFSDTHFVLFGFSQSSVKRFLELTFKKPSLYDQFKQWLSDHPLAQAMVTVPLYCAMITKLYLHRKGDLSFNSITELTILFVLALIESCESGTLNYFPVNVISDFSKPITDQLKILMQAAMYMSSSKKFCSNQPISNGLGLISERGLSCKHKRWHFKHSIIQEILAALYCAKKDAHTMHCHWHLYLFLCGLKFEPVLNLVQLDTIKEKKNWNLNWADCVDELAGNWYTTLFEAQAQTSIDSVSATTPFQWFMAGWCVGRSITPASLDFSEYALHSPQSLKLFHKGLKFSLTEGVSRSPTHSGLSNVVIDADTDLGKCANMLPDLYLSESLQRLTLKGSLSNARVDCLKLDTYAPKLTELELQVTGDSALQCSLFSSLSRLSNLNALSFHSAKDLSDNVVNILSEYLTMSNSLNKLTITAVPSSSEMLTEAVLNSLKGHPTLDSLSLSHMAFNTTTMTLLSEVISSCTFGYLKLFESPLQVEQIEHSLSMNATISHLELINCSVTPEGAMAIARVIEANEKLHQLKLLQDASFSGAAAIELARALETNLNLQLTLPSSYRFDLANQKNLHFVDD